MLARRSFVSLAALAAGGLALGACGAPQAGRQVVSPAATTRAQATGGCAGVPTVTATALGQASATPDTLLLTLGVETEAPTVAAALATDDTKTLALVATLQSAGIPAADVQSTNLSISPDYNGKGTLDGYSVTDVVSVTDPDVASASRVIDGAVAAAGNSLQFDNLQLALSNDATPAIEARVDAVRRAEARAAAMATAAGSTLGPLCSISDAKSPIYQPAGSSGAPELRSAGASGAPSVPTPVEAGSQTVVAQVTVVYAVG